MFTVIVPANALKALAITAAHEDVRGYLCGVCVDTTTDGRVHLVSTDGHRMLIVNAKLDNGGERVAGRFIVPTEALKNAKPAHKNGPVLISLNPEADHGGTYEVRGKVTVSGRCLDGRYPDWTRVISQTRDVRKPGAPAHFNFDYVGDFGRIATLLEEKCPRIVPNGDASAHVYLGKSAFGVLMPMRIGEKETHAPLDWLEAVREDVAKAA